MERTGKSRKGRSSGSGRRLFSPEPPHEESASDNVRTPRKGVRTRGGHSGSGSRPERPSLSDGSFLTTISTEPGEGSPMNSMCQQGGSGASTPRTPGSGVSTPRSSRKSAYRRVTPRKGSAAKSASNRKRPSKTPLKGPAAKRSIMFTSRSSPTPGHPSSPTPGDPSSPTPGDPSSPSLGHPSSPIPRDPSSPIPEVCDVQFEFVNYGSEEEAEDGDDEMAQPVMMPRTSRMFLEAEEDEGLPVTNAAVSFIWPPKPSKPTNSAPSRADASPSAIVLPLFPNASDPQPNDATSNEDADILPSPATSAAKDYNLDKFDFVWRGFSQPQMPPEERREPFTVTNCGPVKKYKSPYDAFCDIWDDVIMERIVSETNAYAKELTKDMIANGSMQQNSRISKWRDTTLHELRVYFAIILATGIVGKSRIEEYWNKSQDIFSTPEFSTALTINRFLLLSRCLHFQSNSDASKTMRPSQAKLYKIQPILDHLNSKFSQLYVLSQNLALDESLTMWKGWLSINQFIKHKKASVGIKTYEVCESQTGYLWRFEVHAGHDDTSESQDDAVSGTLPTLVLRLLNGLEHKGHTIWMDNYYNSPALARELKVRGFDCVGTLRTNRRFVPSELKNLKKEDMAIGQVCGCTSGDVDLFVWRDTTRVAFVSTYHGLATTWRDGTLKPTVAPDYNLNMGGVDLKDQLLATYPIERKRNKIWYKKFFRRLLNVSVLNAYILYKAHHPISHRSFRKSLILKLLSMHVRRDAPKPCSSLVEKSFGHYPAQYEFFRPNERHRRQCQVCKKRTTNFCTGCDKPMCAFTCFEPYHVALFQKGKIKVKNPIMSESPNKANNSNPKKDSFLSYLYLGVTVQEQSETNLTYDVPLVQ